MPRRVVLVVVVAVGCALVALGLADRSSTPDAAPTGPCEAGFAGARCADPSTSSTAPRSTTSAPDGTPSTPVPQLALPPAGDPMRPARLLDIDTPSPSLPNPFVLVHDGEYLMFTTEAMDGIGAVHSVPVLRSRDLRTWDFLHDALPYGGVGDWAVPGATWAPDVARTDTGWVLYYTARHGTEARETQCIGVATAAVPIGPYAPAPEPIVCQLDRGGSIDPRTFRDADGQLWLHWKSDDNSDVEGTSMSTIYAQRLSTDGTTLVGEPARILEVTQPWEGRIVEAPHMIEADGRLWLFYSANWFNQPYYGIGAATCETPAGPCTKPFDGPWLASNAQGEGPGEASLFQDLEGRWRMVYAPVAQQYRDETDRPIALATVGFDAAGPYLAEPD